MQCALNFALKYYFIPFSPLYFVHSFDAVFARIDSFFSGLCWLETRKEVVYNQPFFGGEQCYILQRTTECNHAR